MATDKALPREKGSDARIPLSPYRHFERKREIFFVRAEMVYACERKREA